MNIIKCIVIINIISLSFVDIAYSEEDDKKTDLYQVWIIDFFQ